MIDLAGERCSKMRNDDYSRQGFRLSPNAETLICALNEQSLGDIRNGDSGGPLMQKSYDGRWYLVGVVSGHWDQSRLTKKNAPGLYTRVGNFTEVVRSIARNACWGYVNKPDWLNNQ